VSRAKSWLLPSDIAPQKEEAFTQSIEQTPLEVNDENLLSYYTTKIKIS
jgi:hypothetical protein